MYRYNLEHVTHFKLLHQAYNGKFENSFSIFLHYMAEVYRVNQVVGEPQYPGIKSLTNVPQLNYPDVFRDARKLLEEGVIAMSYGVGNWITNVSFAGLDLFDDDPATLLPAPGCRLITIGLGTKLSMNKSFMEEYEVWKQEQTTEGKVLGSVVIKDRIAYLTRIAQEHYDNVDNKDLTIEAEVLRLIEVDRFVTKGINLHELIGKIVAVSPHHVEVLVNLIKCGGLDIVSGSGRLLRVARDRRARHISALENDGTYCPDLSRIGKNHYLCKSPEFAKIWNEVGMKALADESRNLRVKPTTKTETKMSQNEFVDTVDGIILNGYFNKCVKTLKEGPVNYFCRQILTESLKATTANQISIISLIYAKNNSSVKEVRLAIGRMIDAGVLELRNFKDVDFQEETKAKIMATLRESEPSNGRIASDFREVYIRPSFAFRKALEVEPVSTPTSSFDHYLREFFNLPKQPSSMLISFLWYNHGFEAKPTVADLVEGLYFHKAGTRQELQLLLREMILVGVVMFHSDKELSKEWVDRATNALVTTSTTVDDTEFRWGDSEIALTPAAYDSIRDFRMIQDKPSEKNPIVNVTITLRGKQLSLGVLIDFYRAVVLRYINALSEERLGLCDIMKEVDMGSDILSMATLLQELENTGVIPQEVIDSARTDIADNTTPPPRMTNRGQGTVRDAMDNRLQDRYPLTPRMPF